VSEGLRIERDLRETLEHDPRWWAIRHEKLGGMTASSWLQSGGDPGRLFEIHGRDPESVRGYLDWLLHEAPGAPPRVAREEGEVRRSWRERFARGLGPRETSS
jgi:hypothetical protein